MNLKLSQLRLVAAIAEHGQLQLAASTLALSQPAASRILAEVEQTVGTRLFDRHPKGMELTEMGRLIARHAHEMIVGMRDLAREVADLREGRGGIVRTGSVTGPALGFLVPAIRQLKAAAPDVQVVVDVAPSVNLVRGLMAGDYDFVVARCPDGLRRSDVTVQLAGVETVRFLARRDHPLAGQAALPLSALGRHEWIIQDRAAPIRHVVEDALMRHGVRPPSNTITTSSLLLMMGFLRDSNAVAPMSAEVVALLDHPGSMFCALDMAEDLIVPPYYVIEARSRTLSPVATRLKRLLLAELRAADPARTAT